VTAPALQQPRQLATVLEVLVPSACADVESTIPICPPNQTARPCEPCCADSVSLDLDPALEQTTVAFDGRPDFADALVHVLNRTRGVGVIVRARADGSAGPTSLPASVGDEIEISLGLGDQVVTACVIVIDDGWNAGYSERGGVGRVARYLEQRGVTHITIDTLYENARAAGASRHLSNAKKVAWSKGVAALYQRERARDAARPSA